MTQPLRTFLYARVSSKPQEVESQLPVLTAWATQHCPDAVLVKDKCSGKTMKRPEWSQIMQAVKDGKTKKIVVCHWSRLGRNMKDGVLFAELCMKHEVELISIWDGSNIATPGGLRDFYKSIADAEFDNSMRSRITKNGIAFARAKAKAEGREWKTGGSRPGWRHKVSQDMADAIFSLYHRGWSYNRIAINQGTSGKTVKDVIVKGVRKVLTRAELNAKFKKKK